MHTASRAGTAGELVSISSKIVNGKSLQLSRNWWEYVDGLDCVGTMCVINDGPSAVGQNSG